MVNEIRHQIYGQVEYQTQIKSWDYTSLKSGVWIRVWNQVVDNRFSLRIKLQVEEDLND